MDVYNDLHEITDEVVRVFGLAGVPASPPLVVGIANMVCLLRYMEKNKMSDSAQEALVRLIKQSNDGLCHLDNCPIVEAHRAHGDSTTFVNDKGDKIG